MLSSLSSGEQIAVAGAVAVPFSMLLPWYGFKLGSPLSATAIDSFTFAHLALLVACGAVLWLTIARGGTRWPRPLSEGGLLIAAGVWCALILAYLVADPPDILEDTLPIGGVRIRYGILLAFAGAGGMVLGGMRVRSAKNEAERPEGRPASASEVPRGSGQAD